MADGYRSFVTLDGMRGIAAIAIVTRHAPDFFQSISLFTYPEGRAPYPIGPFFEGYLAVDFFFVLSGFVLAYAYGERLRAGMTAGEFMSLRLVRLYPLYLLAVALSAITALPDLAHASFRGVVALNLVAAALFLPSPTNYDLFPFNVPAWSLFFELAANAVLGVAGRRASARALAAFVAIAGGLLICAVVAGVLGFRTVGFGAMDHGYEWTTLGAGILRVAYSFPAGILVYVIWARWRPSRNVPWLVVVGALMAILVANPPATYRAAFDLTATVLVFPCLVWLGASSAATGWSARVFTRLGFASYALYILHAPLYSLVSALLTAADIVGPFAWPTAVVYILCVLAVAIAVDAWFDQPVRRLLARAMIPVAALRSPATYLASDPNRGGGMRRRDAAS